MKADDARAGSPGKLVTSWCGEKGRRFYKVSEAEQAGVRTAVNLASVKRKSYTDKQLRRFIELVLQTPTFVGELRRLHLDVPFKIVRIGPASQR